MWGGKVKKILVVLLTLFLTATPFRWDFFGEIMVQADLPYPEDILIEEDTTWHRGEILNLGRIEIDEGARLTIEAGVQVHFAQLIVYWGSIRAEGTASEPVVFSPAVVPDLPAGFEIRTQIYFDTYPEESDYSFFRHAKFQGGGQWTEGGTLAQKNIWQKTLAGDEGDAAIYFQGGRAIFENCLFSDSQYADFEVAVEIDHGENPMDYLKITNSNFEKNDEETKALTGEVYCELAYPSDCQDRVVLTNNWYGDQSGPQSRNNSGLGKAVEGNFSLRGFRQKELIADPLIVVPGIMGSMEKNEGEGEWLADPMLHTYDNLLDSLERNGYQKDLNLFEFPYDWRVENAKTADLLKDKIDQILEKTGFRRVDILAHSMGGLIARSYLEGEGYGRYDVDQLVTLGTPHRGSPKAYLQWEAGEGFFDVAGFLAKHHFKREAKHNGFDSIFEYIRSAIPTVQELLPDYDYLFDVDKNQMRSYPTDYPRNVFLEDLNQEINLEKLNRVEVINISGIADIKNTISEIKVRENEKENLWEDGEPENFYNKETDRGLEYGSGDETVPKFSAQDIPAQKSLEIESSHNELPTKAQCLALENLTGKTDCQYVDDWKFPNLLYFNLFSPVDMQVIDPDGRRVGKNFETGGVFNEISGAFYPGYETQEEFITIPNPKEGEYKVLLEGTASGEYTLEVTNIENDEDQTDYFSANIENQENQEIVFNFSNDFVDFGNGDDETISAVSETDDSEDDSDEDTKKKTSDDEKDEFFSSDQNFLLVGMAKSKSEEFKEAIYKEGENRKNPEIRGMEKEDYSLNIFSSMIILGMLLGSVKRSIIRF